MIQNLTKMYEGADVSSPRANLIYLPVLFDCNLQAIDVLSDEAVASPGAVFTVYRNGVEIPSSSVSIATDDKLGTVSGLDVDLTRGDEIILNLALGSAAAPLTLNLTVDDGQSGGGGISPALEFSPADASGCVFFWNEQDLNAETDLAAVAQMTDSSGSGNDAVQATSGKQAKILLNAASLANGLLFTRANQTNYITENSLSIRHVFAVAAYFPIGSANIGGGTFDDYIPLLCSEAGYFLVGESVSSYWRQYELDSTYTYAIDGREIVGIGGSQPDFLAQIASNTIPYRLHLYEMRSDSAKVGKLLIGSQDDIAGRYWNGVICAVACYSSIKSGDELKKIRRALCLRAGIAPRV